MKVALPNCGRLAVVVAAAVVVVARVAAVTAVTEGGETAGELVNEKLGVELG